MDCIIENNYSLFESQNKNNNNNLNVLLLQSHDEKSLIDICNEKGFKIYLTKTSSKAYDLFLTKKVKNKSEVQPFFQVVIINSALDSENETNKTLFQFIKQIRSLSKNSFITIFSKKASEDAKMRINFFDLECNMVTNCFNSLEKVLTNIKLILKKVFDLILYFFK